MTDILKQQDYSFKVLKDANDQTPNITMTQLQPGGKYNVTISTGEKDSTPSECYLFELGKLQWIESLTSTITYNRADILPG